MNDWEKVMSSPVLDTRFALSDEYMHEYYMSEAKTMVIGMNVVNHVLCKYTKE